jgi:hypothetical protein
MPGGLNVRTAGRPTSPLSEPPCPSGFPGTLPLGRDGYDLTWAFKDQNPYPKTTGMSFALSARPARVRRG